MEHDASKPSISPEGLAAELGLSRMRLTYLESLAGVRTIRDAQGQQRFRMRDAQLLAGLSIAVYDDGAAARDVRVELETTGRERFEALGSARIGEAVGNEPAARLAVPPDTRLRTDEALSAAPSASAVSDRERAYIMAELMACLRTLEEGR